MEERRENITEGSLHSDHAETKLANQFAANLFGMLKAVHLYPKGHQMLLQVVEKFFNYMNWVLAEKQMATLRIFENNLYIFDHRIDPERIAGTEQFIEELQKRYIRQVIFEPPVTISDLSALSEALGTEPENIASLGGASVILEKNGGKNIKIIEYYSRRHVSLDEERLLNLTNSEIFRFFTNEEMHELSKEHTHFLYELLKESALVCALVKVAAQFIIREQKPDLSESRLILRILNKIRKAITSMELSEEKEIRTILKDLISAFEDEELFSLVYEGPDDEILKYTEAATYLSGQLSTEKTAELITRKLEESKQDSSVITHTKNVLSRLFLDRAAFLNFLPVLKENLQTSIPDSEQAEGILNDLCSAFAPGFSLEEDAELALGTISDEEKKDIVFGLNILKTVHLDREALQLDLVSFDLDLAYLPVLKTILCQESAPENFQRILRKIIQEAQNSLQKDNMQQSKKILFFLTEQLQASSQFSDECKNITVETASGIPDILIDKLLINLLFEADDQQAKKTFATLMPLFRDKLLSLMVKMYAHEEDMPKVDLVREIILEHYKPGAIKIDANLKNEPYSNVLRIIELLQHIKSDEVLPLIWQITYHENTALAERALKIIANTQTSQGLMLLLSVITHPNVPLRLEGIDLLGNFRYKQVRDALIPVARGQTGLEDESLNANLRMQALRSITKIDPKSTKVLVLEILNNKKWGLLPIESKTLRTFAKDILKQLKQVNN